MKDQIEKQDQIIKGNSLEMERMMQQKALTDLICSELIRYKSAVSEACASGVLINSGNTYLFSVCTPFYLVILLTSALIDLEEWSDDWENLGKMKDPFSHA